MFNHFRVKFIYLFSHGIIAPPKDSLCMSHFFNVTSIAVQV